MHIRYFLIVLLLCSGTLLTAQISGRFYEANWHELDSKLSELGPLGNMVSSKKISQKEVKYDRGLIGFINWFYNNTPDLVEVRSRLEKTFGKKWSMDSVDLGGIYKYNTRLRTKGNLSAELAFSLYRQDIIYKRISFETRTRLDTLDSNKKSHGAFVFQDAIYLRDNLLSVIDFPVTYFFGDVFQFDTVYHNKIARIDTSQHRFATYPYTRMHKYITWFDNDTYSGSYVEECIGKLVKEKRIDLLAGLLYSPNHVFALEAMEALIFLQETEQVGLSDELKGKMEAVRSADIVIMTQHSDVVSHLKYSDLRITTGDIINKFRATKF
ncbi:MAG: hypothetical protein QM731_24875 [Chitinophagaceae bacterium]